MANPRQKRKQRSGTAKNTLSRGSRKSQRKVVVKGPEVLSTAWDKTKTVRQNYARLGLMSNVNPRLSGGIEKDASALIASRKRAREEEMTMSDFERDEQQDDDGALESDEESQRTAQAPTSQRQKENDKMLVGFGRIIRDENGKPIKIVLPGQDGEPEVVEKVKNIVRSADDDDDEDESDEDEQETPWGATMRDFTDAKLDHLPSTAAQGIPFNPSRGQVEAKTAVVKRLEELSARQAPVERHTSAFELDWLLSLVQKHDEDVSAMARDRKLNVWQKTPGELKKAVAKAGGFAKLREQLAQQSASSSS